MKEHLAKKKGNVLICKDVPPDVFHQMNQSLEGTGNKNKDKELDDAYDDQSQPQTNEQVAPIQPSQMVPNSNLGKQKATYFAPRTTLGSQPTIKSIIFVKSVDASGVVKDAQMLCNLFSEVIEWVGYKNVVHVVTDNAANYVAVERKIHEKYDSIFWSPCAAHYLNLLLKDISSMPHVAELASKASKNDLQALMVDKHFTSHKLAKSTAGKMVSAIVLDSSFWSNCFMIAKIMALIIKLLKIVDGDERPSMGYVYDGMQRVKNSIENMFRNRKTAYQPYTNIIKARWDKHLKRDLHAAAYFFNPVFQYGHDFNDKSRVTEALIKLFEVKSLCPYASKAFQEVQMYRDRKGSFGKSSVVTLAANIQPAIRILGQTSSSSGCERNWSFFERIHTKRRNRLEHQRLNDLVYVAYNLRLQNRGKPNKIYYDPIDYEPIDDIDFWVNEEAPPENSSRNNKGDDEFDTSDFVVEADNDVGGSNGEDVGISNVNFDYGETNFDDYNDFY
ncbi:uncharacterized protein LOC123922868 [Trifolium pratense]|uniref:uncharacterized protein LOC123922868 n=1 Tax=Trifolium pratense TaxID=57577 RepID=UPI001E698033|nr:uncharacterized protein LOC123922868 [Trifolium pratense]